MAKILMVCLGNICRSPLAEGILKSKLPKSFTVESAGTGDWHVGSPPDKRSVAIAKANNLDISSQKGRQFTKSDFDTFDYIYAMDQSNYQNIVSLAPNELAKSKVKLILNELYPSENMDVPDPYFGIHNGFENVYEMLNSACDIIAQKLLRSHSEL